VRNQPLWNVLMMGLIFTAVGALVLLIGAHRTNLVCEPAATSQVSCTIQSDWMGYFPQEPRTIREVQQAYVDESCDSDGCTYRVILEGLQGSEPVTNVYSSGFEPKQRVASQVNAYIGSGNFTPLELRLDLNLGWFAIIPAIFLILGMLFLGSAIAQLVVRAAGWHPGTGA
jgi:hypothetical protein